PKHFLTLCNSRARLRRRSTVVRRPRAGPTRRDLDPTQGFSMTQWVYGFGGGSADGDASMKNLLGGKGANLAEMAKLGLPVPPGFTISTEVCTYYYAHGRSYPPALRAEVAQALARIEK